MAKKKKAKRKGFGSAEVLSLVEPCGEVCGVDRGVLCRECGEFAMLKRIGTDVDPNTGEDAETSARSNEVFYE